MKKKKYQLLNLLKMRVKDYNIVDFIKKNQKK